MARVSIIINCLNGEEFLQETLDSINKQTFRDWTIIFIDNCSTDNTSEIAKRFGDNLHYFKTEKTIPLGQARNLALGYADSEWIAFLDSDDLWREDKLEKQIEIANSYKDVGLIMSNFYTYNMLKDTINIVHPNWKSTRLSFKEFVCGYSYCLSSFMIKKDVLERLNTWFDNRLEYAEEYDLFCRMAYYSDVFCLKEPLVKRRIHKGMTTMKLAKRIPEEHQIALDNLRNLDSAFDQKYPEVVYNIQYLINYLESKRLFPLGENIKIRQLMKPYRFYNKRAFAYYEMACMPTVISKAIYKIIYKGSISGEE